MKSDTFEIAAEDGTNIFCYQWMSESIRAVVQIAHGGAEHAGRYEPVAARLVEAGYAVYAEDHRGHGYSAKEGALGDMGPANAFENICNDIIMLSQHIASQRTDVPLFILGHSIGSLLTQRVLIENSAQYAGAVLSGTPSVDVLLAAKPLVDGAVRSNGRNGSGEELQMGMFASFLEAIPDPRTPFDWLSRSEAEVDKYAEDPLCGFAIQIGGWADIIEGSLPTIDADAVALIQASLPVYVFSGEQDPVHSNGSAIERLLARYASAGLQKITKRYYEGGRHEMFNETNRDEVIDDLVAWLDDVVDSIE